MRSRLSLAVLPLLVVSGCSQIAFYGRGAMPGPQGRAALASESTDKPIVGHVDGALQPVGGRETASSPYATSNLTYMGMKEGRICFTFPYESQYFRSHETVAQDIAQREAGFSKMVLLFQARASFDDLTDDTLWPLDPLPSTQVLSASVVDHKVSKHWHTRSDGSRTSTESLRTIVEVCGNAPAWSASTRYLTVSSFPSDKLRAPAMFVWIIDGGGAAPTTPPTATPASTPATPSPTPVTITPTQLAGDRDLVATIRVTGCCATFLKIAEASGLIETLRSGGPFTVFAPPDKDFDAVWLKMYEGHPAEVGAEMVKAHMLAEALSLDQLNLPRLDRATVYGNKIRISMKSGYLLVDTARATKTEYRAKNGVVYLVDRMVRR